MTNRSLGARLLPAALAVALGVGVAGASTVGASAAPPTKRAPMAQPHQYFGDANDGKLPPLPTGAVQITSMAQFTKDVEQESSKRTVIMDFSKDGCIPCAQLAPVVDEKYQADKGKWQFARIDGTAVQDVWAKFDNPWFPTVIAFRNGKELGRLSGYAGDKKAMLAWIDKAAAGESPYSDPLVMNISNDTELAQAKDISRRHPVILRLYDQKAKDTTPEGEMAGAMARGDGGKWTLAHVDTTTTTGKQVLAMVGSKGQAVEWAKHVIMYMGKPRYDDKLTALGLSTADDAAKTKLREWVNAALSFHYPDGPEPTPSPTDTVVPTPAPTDTVVPTPDPTPVPTDTVVPTPDPQPTDTVVPPAPPAPPGPPGPPGPPPPPGPDFGQLGEIIKQVIQMIMQIFGSFQQ